MHFKVIARRVLDRPLNAWWDFQIQERYWKLRNLARVFEFRIRLWLFNTQFRVERSRSVAKDSWAIVRQSLGALSAALALFFLLTSSEAVFRANFPNTHGHCVALTNWILRKFDSRFEGRVDVYASFLGGMASVSGVFLGLYFTAVSIGTGQQIGSLSPRVRHLVVNERKGRLYIRLLSTLAALSFLLWANAVALGNISYPAICFITAYGLFLIVAFYPLGLQSFYLADPTSIAYPVFISINANLRRIRRRTKISTHPSFDKFYRQQTLADLSLLDEIAHLTLLRERPDRDQIGNLIINLNGQILLYLDFKHAIESESQWYRRTQKYDDWLMIDDFKGRMLEQLGNTGEPKEEPDPHWFEREGLKLVEKFLKDYSKRKDVEGLIYIASCLRRYVDGLAARLEVGFALEVFQLLNKYTKPVYSDPELPCPSRLQLSDCTAILQIDIVQQSMLRIVDANPNKEIEALADAVFKRNGRTPISTLPATKILVESLAAKVSSERDIEGRVISPRWYIAQLIARSFGEQVDKLFSQLTKIPERPAADLPKPNNFENAAVEILIIQRNMEAVARLISHESKFVRFTQHLKEFEKIKDLPIKNMEEGAATNDFGETMDRCFDRLGDLLLPVFQHHRDIELPDFFGMTYFRLCNELFRQIQENEHARFKQLYPKVLAAAFFARQRLLKEYDHVQDVVTKARISFDPIFDMMALGGYAAIYSELNDSPTLVETVTSAWIHLFSLLQMDTDKCAWILGIYQVTSRDLRFSGRDPTRFNWWRSLVDTLIDRHLIEERFARYGEETTEPTTPILKALCRSGNEPHEDIREIFLAVFLPLLGANEQTMNTLNSRFYRELHTDDDAGDGL